MSLSSNLVTAGTLLAFSCCWSLLTICQARLEVPRIKITTSAGNTPSTSNPDLPWNVFERGQQVNVTCSDPEAPAVLPIIVQQNGLALTNKLQQIRGAVTTIHKHGVTQISISSFDAINEGDYSCLYQTWTMEATSATATLLMARNPVINMSSVTMVNISQPLELTCSATGVPPPQVQIVVLATGQLLANQTEVVMGDLQHGKQQTVAVWREAAATLNMNGRYVCMAGNAMSQQRQTGNISIQYPARIVKFQRSPASMPAAGQNPLTFGCQATGNPLPVLVWSLNGTAYTARGDGGRISQRNISHYSVLSTLSLTTLALSNSGVYTCRAKNALGGEEKHETLTVIALPSPPRDLTIARTGLTAVTLSWHAPSWLGNAKQVRYEAYVYEAAALGAGSKTNFRSLYRVDNRSHVHNIAPDSLLTVVSNLKVNTQYGFHVVSKNRAGASIPSNYVQTQTLPDAPPAPLNITTDDIKSTSFNVSWQIPAVARSQGTLSEIQFIVRLRPLPRPGKTGFMFKEVCKTVGFACQVHSLTKGTTYQVVVQAFNRGGMGAPSSVITVATAATIPSPPKWLGARVTGTGSIRLMWQMPGDIGGSHILYWNLAYQRIGENTTTAEVKIEAGTLFYPIEGLEEKMDYQFEMSATNKAGESSSAIFMFSTPHRDDPVQPDSVVVLATSRQSILLTVDDEENRPVMNIDDRDITPQNADALNGDGLLVQSNVIEQQPLVQTLLIRYRPSNSNEWTSIEIKDRYAAVCLNDLSPDTTFTIQSATKRSDEVSVFSIPVVARTDKQGAVPTPVVRTSVLSSLQVSWPACGPRWEPFSVQLQQVFSGAMATNRKWSTIKYPMNVNQPAVIDNLLASTVYQFRISVHKYGLAQYSENLTVTTPPTSQEESHGKTYRVSSTVSVGIISLAAGGGLLLAVVLVVGLLIWRRYRLRQESADKEFVDVPGDTATPSWMSDHLTVSNETSFNPHDTATPGDGILNNEIAISGTHTPSFVVASYQPAIENTHMLESQDCHVPASQPAAREQVATHVDFIAAECPRAQQTEHAVLEAEISYAVLNLPSPETMSVRRTASEQTEYANIALFGQETTPPKLLRPARQEKCGSDAESEDDVSHYYDQPEACEELRQGSQLYVDLPQDF